MAVRQRDAPVHRVELPGELVDRLGSTDAQRKHAVLELVLIELFRRGEVSSGWAAERLGIPRWDFIQLLAERGVPYADLSPEEAHQDVETLRAHLGLPRRPEASEASTPAA